MYLVLRHSFASFITEQDVCTFTSVNRAEPSDGSGMDMEIVCGGLKSQTDDSSFSKALGRFAFHFCCLTAFMSHIALQLYLTYCNHVVLMSLQFGSAL